MAPEFRLHCNFGSYFHSDADSDSRNDADTDPQNMFYFIIFVYALKIDDLSIEVNKTFCPHIFFRSLKCFLEHLQFGSAMEKV
jgi:hypothetical protein